MLTPKKEKTNLMRVSVSQAANLFGVSEKSIRTAIKKEDLLYVIARGRYKINFDSLLSWYQKSTRRRNQRDSIGIGQHVLQWKIKNKKYSPNPERVN